MNQENELKTLIKNAIECNDINKARMLINEYSNLANIDIEYFSLLSIIEILEGDFLKAKETIKTGTMAAYCTFRHVRRLRHTTSFLVQNECAAADFDVDDELAPAPSGDRNERWRGEPLDKCTGFLNIDTTGRAALPCNGAPSCKIAFKV